jgi:Protein of unknown function (DUF3072)
MFVPGADRHRSRLGAANRDGALAEIGKIRGNPCHLFPVKVHRPPEAQRGTTGRGGCDDPLQAHALPRASRHPSETRMPTKLIPRRPLSERWDDAMDPWRPFEASMTACQRSLLKALCAQAKVPFDDRLTKEQALRRIIDLRGLIGLDVSGAAPAGESVAGEEDPGACLDESAMTGVLSRASQSHAMTRPGPSASRGRT